MHPHLLSEPWIGGGSSSIRQYTQQHYNPRITTVENLKESTSDHSHQVKPNHSVLPHLNTAGHMHMTDVGRKASTRRYARAACVVHFTNDITFKTLTRTHDDDDDSISSSESPQAKKGPSMVAKGDVFAAARVAGIMAAKRTPDIVPLCHPSIGIDSVSIDITLHRPASPHTATSASATAAAAAAEGNCERKFEFGAVEIVAVVTCEGRTGVEMEAMTAVMGAALTVYDMCKANDKGMVIDSVRLLEKRGGKSGVWTRDTKI